MTTRRTFLDATGSARPDQRVLDAVSSQLAQTLGTPGRTHHEGLAARHLLDAARAAFADSLGVQPNDIIVTSSHVQAVHLGIRAATAARARVGRGIVLSRGERTTVLHAARFSGDPLMIEVNDQGRVNVSEFVSAVQRPGIALAALQHSNAEVGTIQPTAEVLTAARDAGVPLFVDAASSGGNVALGDSWDLLALDAGEWGSPFRIGVLAARSRVRLRPQWPEDSDAWFPGGVDPIAVFAAAAAFQVALADLENEDARRRHLTAHFRKAATGLNHIEVMGPDDQRLPHTVTLALQGVDGEALATELDRRGIAVGTGSSCSSSTVEPNHVLTAMGARFGGSIRITLDRYASAEDVEILLTELPAAMEAVSTG